MATFDAVLSERARRFRDSLHPGEAKEFTRALEALLRDPAADGQTKVPLPFPYRPGTLGFAFGRFLISYVFENPLTITVLDASRVIEPPV